MEQTRRRPVDWGCRTEPLGCEELVEQRLPGVAHSLPTSACFRQDWQPGKQMTAK